MSDLAKKLGAGYSRAGERVEQRRNPGTKNKSAAPLQITAEHLVREAYDKRDDKHVEPVHEITSQEELEEYQLRKRADFESDIRKNPDNLNHYVRYAKWEEKQRDFTRARNIMERGLDVDYRQHHYWLRYAELEMRHGFVQSARNVWDRAVSYLPRVEQLWYKYAYMEEMLGNVNGAREIFRRWMRWMPEPRGWNTFINFEKRYKEWDNAREIFEAYIRCHPMAETWLKFSKFEEELGNIDGARDVLERALQALPEEECDENLYIAFANFEERQREFERARVIYKYALDHIPRAKAPALFAKFTSFEKRFGDREGIEEVVIGKRRFQYEADVVANPHDYDTWFDYLRLEESAGDVERVRDLYARAVANVPLVREKRYWERYIYLWVYYVVYEETEAGDIDKAREGYQAVIQLVPHQEFSFALLWILYAQFEIRQRDLDAARSIYGRSIGLSPSPDVFDKYIQLEFDLLNFDRCRKLYAKYLELMPENCEAWIKCAEFERSLAEHERARAVYEIAVNEPLVDMPEVLWKAYIDFEADEGTDEQVYVLFERLLERTKHVKVWNSYARFADSRGDTAKARLVYGNADTSLKNTDLKEERVILLEAWRDFEVEKGNAEMVQAVSAKLPQKIKKRRMVHAEDGTELGWEEYYDYIFPDEDQRKSNFKLLEMARKWKQAQDGDGGDDEAETSEAGATAGGGDEDMPDAEPEADDDA